jgi:hypothetical protein
MRKDPFELATKAFEDRVEDLERQVLMTNMDRQIMVTEWTARVEKLEREVASAITVARVAFVVSSVAAVVAVALLFSARF